MAASPGEERFNCLLHFKRAAGYAATSHLGELLGFD
jgi:hypothetical protein